MTLRVSVAVACGWLACWIAAGAAPARQVPVDSHDPNGLALTGRLLHLVHSTDETAPGTTAHLRVKDPWLLYQLGRELTQRKFVGEEGVYGRAGELSVPMYVGPGAEPGSVARFARDHAASCGSCHSIPYREPGGGQTIASTGGAGRNSPHFYGAGLVEMIGERIRAAILSAYDANGNGRIELGEVAGASPARVRPAPGAAPIDFGDLALGPDRQPQLNPLFRLWYVDAHGRVLGDASDARDARVAAFDFVPEVFGWGRGHHVLADGRRVPQGAEAATLRGIFALAADVHMGLQAFDVVQQLDDGGMGGFAGASLSGARQVDFGAAPDRGRRRTATGVSLDDPDGDGVVTELTAGDLDAAEFYLLHAPQPAFLETPASLAGRRVFRRIGCTRCHVEDWQIDDDRRLFRLDTLAPGGRRSDIRVRLTAQSQRVGATGVARREPSVVRGVYSDFKHWDVGPAFYERRFDGTIQRQHRTAPLWGVADTAPYGAAGQFQTLEAVVLAHGGAASVERDRYVELGAIDRRRLRDFLLALVLFPTDRVAADIDGDGRFAERFVVRGVEVGHERLDARFLFATPPRLERLYEVVDADGRPTPLGFWQDLRRAFQLDLPWRRDTDGDGFPDAIDPMPHRVGVMP